MPRHMPVRDFASRPDFVSALDTAISDTARKFRVEPKKTQTAINGNIYSIGYTFAATPEQTSNETPANTPTPPTRRTRAPSPLDNGGATNAMPVAPSGGYTYQPPPTMQPPTMQPASQPVNPAPVATLPPAPEGMRFASYQHPNGDGTTKHGTLAEYNATPGAAEAYKKAFLDAAADPRFGLDADWLKKGIVIQPNRIPVRIVGLDTQDSRSSPYLLIHPTTGALYKASHAWVHYWFHLKPQPRTPAAPTPEQPARQRRQPAGVAPKAPKARSGRQPAQAAAKASKARKTK